MDSKNSTKSHIKLEYDNDEIINILYYGVLDLPYLVLLSALLYFTHYYCIVDIAYSKYYIRAENFYSLFFPYSFIVCIPHIYISISYFYTHLSFYDTFYNTKSFTTQKTNALLSNAILPLISHQYPIRKPINKEKRKGIMLIQYCLIE